MGGGWRLLAVRGGARGREAAPGGGRRSLLAKCGRYRPAAAEVTAAATESKGRLLAARSCAVARPTGVFGRFQPREVANCVRQRATAVAGGQKIRPPRGFFWMESFLP